MTNREESFPIGASITTEQLTAMPYDALAQLREREPVSWVPALGAWFVTRRDLAIEAMKDADRFTVDDDRFTTGAILGKSMLNTDGDEHARHRRAFAASFRPKVVRERFEADIVAAANRLVSEIAAQGMAELRTTIAGPLAVETIIGFLGLQEVAVEDVLGWYADISAAIVDLTLGKEVAEEANIAIADLRLRITETLASDMPSLIAEIESDGILHPDEMASAVAVVMFGAIETSEGMTANAFWHLLSHPEALARVREDRSLLAAVVDESLRLEPAAAVIDRYTTTGLSFGGAELGERDLVTISLLAANRDPDVFDDPDRFDIERSNLTQHVTFVQGPHACLGLHVARAETHAALNAVLDAMPGISLDEMASTSPEGLIFRKPASVAAKW